MSDETIDPPDNEDERHSILHASGIDIETTEARYDRLKGDRRALPRLRRLDVLVLLCLLLATGATRFWRLGEPGKVLPSNDPTCVASQPLDKTC